MRQYLPGGQRGPWHGGADAPVPFQRANGTVMTEEEIKRVAQVQQVDAAKLGDNRRPRQALSDAQLDEAWRLANEHGQADAARRLAMTQAGLQGRLVAYQKRHGLTGPLPGMRTTQRTASSNGHDRKQVRTPDRSTSERDKAALLDSTNGSSEARVAEHATDQQVDTKPVGHVVEDFRQRAYDEGYQAAVDSEPAPAVVAADVAYQAVGEAFEQGVTAARDMTSEQAVLVLAAVIAPWVVGSSTGVARAAIERLSKYGFTLVIRS